MVMYNGNLAVPAYNIMIKYRCKLTDVQFSFFILVWLLSRDRLFTRILKAILKFIRRFRVKTPERFNDI